MGLGQGWEVGVTGSRQGQLLLMAICNISQSSDYSFLFSLKNSGSQNPRVTNISRQIPI